MKSKTNLELKHYCSDFGKIRKGLKKLGAKKESIKNQKDYFFNLPVLEGKTSPRLKLRIEKDSQLLVYYERPDFKKARGTPSEVGFYTVEDKEFLPFLKKSLGVKAIVEKKREIWRKANTVFHLDIVKGVGKIFEIELQKTGKISPKDRMVFKNYQDKLLPYLGAIIKGSNVDLVKPVI